MGSCEKSQDSQADDNSTALLEFCLCFEKIRLATFKDWPFADGCNCTALKMAQAGFYHCPTDNEPDVACCFVCQKELDGWEPQDDPWKEHESHSPKCALLKLKKNGVKLCEDLTMDQFMALMDHRVKTVANKLHEVTVKEIRRISGEVRSEIEGFRE